MQRLTLAERLSNVAAVPDERFLTVRDASQPAARQVVELVHAEHGQQLWGFARRLGLGDEEAGDVIQETFVRLWRACRDGEPPDRPVAWAFRTAYRLAMDRHRVRRRWLAFVDRQRSPRADPSEARDELLAVWAEVDRLPERQRQVLYLRYRADLTFEDIGKVLGIDASSARSNSSRGIASLRDRLAGKDE
ncbi:MAG TPA: sigma-70 family RNA polymerase sigma factor [Candidatus Limnocylindrales bacterium]